MFRFFPILSCVFQVSNFFFRKFIMFFQSPNIFSRFIVSPGFKPPISVKTPSPHVSPPAGPAAAPRLQRCARRGTAVEGHGLRSLRSDAKPTGAWRGIGGMVGSWWVSYRVPQNMAIPSHHPYSQMGFYGGLAIGGYYPPKKMWMVFLLGKIPEING